MKRNYEKPELVSTVVEDVLCNSYDLDIGELYDEEEEDSKKRRSALKNKLIDRTDTQSMLER